MQQPITVTTEADTRDAAAELIRTFTAREARDNTAMAEAVISWLATAPEGRYLAGRLIDLGAHLVADKLYRPQSAPGADISAEIVAALAAAYDLPYNDPRRWLAESTLGFNRPRRRRPAPVAVAAPVAAVAE